MSHFEFVVEGDPRSKARPRVVKGRTYTPKTTAEAETAVKLAARASVPTTWDLTGPMRLEIDFHLKTARKPDVDNLAKLVLDALHDIVFENDSQVWDLRARRYISDPNPRTVVRVWHQSS